MEELSEEGEEGGEVTQAVGLEGEDAEVAEVRHRGDVGDLVGVCVELFQGQQALQSLQRCKLQPSGWPKATSNGVVVNPQDRQGSKPLKPTEFSKPPLSQVDLLCN